MSDVLLGTPLLATRMWLVIGALIWSLSLTLPSSISPDTEYFLMDYIAPHYIWSIAFFVQSLWAFYTLKTNHTNKLTLVMDGLLGSTLWMSTTLLGFASTVDMSLGITHAIIYYVPPHGMAAQTTLTIASLWHLARHWADATLHGKFERSSVITY